MTTTHEAQVRDLLQQWAAATRKGQRDDVLANHLPDVLIYDVLAPMKYQGAAAYRQSWDEWQPDTQGEGQFELQDLSVTVGGDVAFAHCFIKCGGVLPNGKRFEDLVRATSVCAKNLRRGKLRTSTSRNPSNSGMPSRY
jgi:ketosteroid isomerase-like protein